ncbi:MAG: hypothetical protein DSY92_02975 [Planctomycetota bacterium]|nr:MAG: hypothetical protein DSY92_02975 [Planctomycetota bacterium]
MYNADAYAGTPETFDHSNLGEDFEYYHGGKLRAKNEKHRMWDPSCHEVLTLLIEAGADVNAKDDDGDTPLTLAWDLYLMQILRAAGAKR